MWLKYLRYSRYIKYNTIKYNLTVVLDGALFSSCIRSCVHPAWSMYVSFRATWGLDGFALPYDDDDDDDDVTAAKTPQSNIF